MTGTLDLTRRVPNMLRSDFGLRPSSKLKADATNEGKSCPKVLLGQFRFKVLLRQCNRFHARSDNEKLNGSNAYHYGGPYLS